MVGMLVSSGIYAAQETKKPSNDLPSIPFQRIAVMLFLKGRFESPNGQIDKPLNQPLTHITINQQSLREDADQVLTRFVAEILKGRFRDKLVPVDQTRSLYTEISKDSALNTPRKLAKYLGERLQAELVVVGSVWRYRDRRAIKDMPDTSAAIAFEVYLVDTVTGKRLWRGKFDETQQTSSDDVFRGLKQIKKTGIKKLTTDELARYGVKEVFKKFPLQ